MKKKRRRIPITLLREGRERRKVLKRFSSSLLRLTRRKSRATRKIRKNVASC
jgi:hypothetical protein